MKLIIYGVLYGAIGAIMTAGGITAGDWEFYAVITCSYASCVAAEIMK